MPVCHELERTTPVVEHADVVVCGGGPAGVVAAIAAARCGADTRLLELQGCLGGTWTAGVLAWIIDAANKPGILREIRTRLDARGAAGPGGERDYSFDPETLKLVLEEMCAEAGVRVQLHTQVVAGQTDAQTRLTHAITESKSGRQAWAAHSFIDATGDGDLAARCGCGYDLGRPETGEMQPMSLMTMVTWDASDIDAVRPYVCNLAGAHGPAKRALAEAMASGHAAPSYAAPVIFHVRDNLFALSAHHTYGVSGLSAEDLTRATMGGRAEMHRQIEGLRSLGGVWSSMRIVATADMIGVREGRRIHGLYSVTVDDMLRGASFEDAVCRVTIGIDVHSTDPGKSKGFATENTMHTKPYDIPLRSLIARDVSGLILAGRCISGDFLAHSSYRVTGNAVPMGEAAGVVAALAARHGVLPSQVSWQMVAEARQQLVKA